ncbi:hypothetical protein EDD18DRAFT_173319 [Armillaria luteobubalina]|uniref:Uncharacterized protein n=1 Tax=Armillaria luteobubalina TaxID=153913 RepID=A0AA39UTG9_9AGAR|nr:hypothetical protein EDD18DRAFT_173319 [Armillaria luteobubalina]
MTRYFLRRHCLSVFFVVDYNVPSSTTTCPVRLPTTHRFYCSRIWLHAPSHAFSTNYKEDHTLIDYGRFGSVLGHARRCTLSHHNRETEFFCSRKAFSAPGSANRTFLGRRMPKAVKSRNCCVWVPIHLLRY